MVQKIVIIGAGVIGAALAYRLQGAAQVTVIDAGGESATDASFGWINASFFRSRDHFHLRAAGIAAYAALAQELSLPLRTTGCISWEHEGAALQDFEAELAALGYPAERLAPEAFRAREPHVVGPAGDSLIYPTEAAAEPGALRSALLAAAQAKGAQVMSGVRATGIAGEVLTTGGPVPADQVVVAAGVGTASLLGGVEVNLPMEPSPAYIVETNVLPPLLSHVLAGPEGEVRQRADGVLISPAAVSHQNETAAEISAQVAADETIARLRRLIPDQSIEWALVTRANRPIPGDGLPVIGHAGAGIYVATMHSGITLAAITADLAATEILTGPTNVTEAQLASFRPNRFSGQKKGAAG